MTAGLEFTEQGVAGAVPGLAPIWSAYPRQTMVARDLDRLDLVGDGYRYRDLERLMAPAEFAAFCAFMVGQTGEIDDEGHFLAFRSDVLNWLSRDRYWD